MDNIQIPEQIKKYFTSSLSEQKLGVIKLCFLREVTSPTVIRSDDSEDVITFRDEISGRELVAINSRKLKSKDKLFGLQLARNNGGTELDSKYNEMPKAQNLANINSILFGDTAVGDDAAGLKARIYYDWAYSVRDYVLITDSLQHNSITESGGIIATQDVGKQKKGELRKNSLFSTKYVLPNTYFPHFVTFTDCTLEMFIHGIFTLLQPKAYGGQTTVQGITNMTNHLVGIITSDYEKPLSSLKISQSLKDTENISLEGIKDHTKKQIIDVYGESNIVPSEMTIQILEEIEDFYLSSHVQSFYSLTKSQSEAYLLDRGYKI